MPCCLRSRGEKITNFILKCFLPRTIQKETQDERRSISENSQLGIRRGFENGQFRMITIRFLGNDMDKNGSL